ncbi:MAG: hypothetical protein NT062_03105 [Proteobacteria bacterium]|nr:hypothetical protein [Pseudomonadota bacterium]
MKEMTYQHSESTRIVLRSLVRVICPPEAAPIADDIVAHMALTIGASPAVLQKLIGTGLTTYDLGALPRYGKRARSLSDAQAEAYYVSWEHGLTPLHVQFARAINQLMSLSCYEQPLMMEAVGFRPGPWIDEVRAKRLRVFAADVARQEAQVLAPDPLRPSKPEAR